MEYSLQFLGSNSKGSQSLGMVWVAFLRKDNGFIYVRQTSLGQKQRGWGGVKHCHKGKKIGMKTSWEPAGSLLRWWLKQSLGKQIGLLLKCCWILLSQGKQQHFKFSASLHFHFLVLCNQSSSTFPCSPLCSRTNQYWSRLHQLIEGNTCLLFWLCIKAQDLFYQFIQVCCLTASSKNTNKQMSVTFF